MPFSQQHADAACNFFELILKHTADEWWGKPFILAPWQEEALCAIFGNVDEDGRRLTKMAYLEVPKKTGKSELVAGLVLMVLVLDPNPGCQIWGAASAQKQAMNVYRAACKMVEQAPVLKKLLRVLRGTNRILKRKDPDSFYAAVAGDGDLSDGVNPSVFVADEVHRWKTRKQLENWDVLSKGGITRKQTLTIAITTAGVQSESPLAWRLHEKTKRIREGIATDPTFFGRIYAADPADDWSAETTWIKANPSLAQNGGFLDISKIREEYESTLSDPAAQTSFRRYFLNLWDQKENRAIPLADWDACAGGWRAAGLLPRAPEDKLRPLPHDVVAHFIERKCWAGVDMSMTTDLSAVTFVFPRADGGFDLLPFFWMPGKDIRKRELRDGVPLTQWAQQGFIELCETDMATAAGASLEPSAVIDESLIKERLIWGAKMFDLQEICFDPWNSRTISGPLTDEGYRCVEIRQGYNTLSEPTKKFLGLIKSHKIGHGAHPVLRWHASCASTKEQNDNIMFQKPERSKGSSRIDGISSSVNGLVRAMLPPASTISVYASRGIVGV